jgi:hypothetical protein
MRITLPTLLDTTIAYSIGTTKTTTLTTNVNCGVLFPTADKGCLFTAFS